MKLKLNLNKKNFLTFLIILGVTLASALFLISSVGRAWNGLAFSDFGDRLGAFIIFSVGFLFFPKPKNFNDKLKLSVLIIAVLVLIAPSVISYFVPENYSRSTETENNFHEIQPRKNQFLPRQEVEYPFHREYSYSETSVRPCFQCHGSGICHKCHKLGVLICHGSIYATCSNGRCTSCNGTGIYNGNRCIVCSGTGSCNICGGTGKVICGYCAGSGKCNYCNGTGKL